MGSIKKYFITGAIAILPLAATVFVLNWLFNVTDDLAVDFVALVTGHRIKGLGVLSILILVFLTGLFTANVLGRTLLNYGEALISRVPIVGVIYRTVKQIIEAFSTDKSAFQRVVMLEYPRKGIYALAFVTGTSEGVLTENVPGKERLVNVFLPTTPNPTSGFLLLVPESELIPVDISVEEGIKLIISGGVITPQSVNKHKVTETVS
ncbi:MAG TPA: DUF502 domain-containing protein [Clostridia bacterium]|nr:DUF502 domain-containing protein [Clostridia bacterium]